MSPFFTLFMNRCLPDVDRPNVVPNKKFNILNLFGCIYPLL